MKHHFTNIKNHIDANGNPTSHKDEILSSLIEAEKLGESLLGCTLAIRGRKFIIRMLEVYYGGAGDDGHDWYRTRFSYKKSKYVEHTKVQELEGFRIYLSSLDVTDTYTRMDIVAGNDGVPISYLLRSVWDENFNLIGAKKGSPNIVLQTMGILPEEHSSEIKLDDIDSEIALLTNNRDALLEKGMTIKRQKRVNLNSRFEDENELLWNLSLE